LSAFGAPALFALLALSDTVNPARSQPKPWLELHAAVSIIAYGAFALAGVAGAMYLAQERQLKTHQLRTIFFHLPPIADLAVAINRLLLAGFVLLTVGLLSGFMVGFDARQVAWGCGVWVVYGVILQAEKLKKMFLAMIVRNVSLDDFQKVCNDKHNV